MATQGPDDAEELFSVLKSANLKLKSPNAKAPAQNGVSKDLDDDDALDQNRVKEAWDSFNRELQNPNGTAKTAEDAFAELLSKLFYAVLFAQTNLAHPKEGFTFTSVNAKKQYAEIKEQLQEKWDDTKKVGKFTKTSGNLFKDLLDYAKSVKSSDLKEKSENLEGLEKRSTKLFSVKPETKKETDDTKETRKSPKSPRPF